MAQLQYKTINKVAEHSGFAVEADLSKSILQAVWSLASFGETVDLAAGFEETVTWAPISGATSVEITSARLKLAAAAVETAEDFLLDKKSQYLSVSPGPAKAIKTLTLSGLELNGEISLTNTTDLNNAGVKLIVLTQLPNGDYSPIYSVPKVAANGVLPASFTGATFNNSTLSFTTPISASTIRIQLVDSGFPEETNSQDISATHASGTYFSLPKDISATLSDGTSVFEFPGVLPLEAGEIDLSIKPQLINSLQTQLDNNQLLDASVLLNASSDSSNQALVQLLITRANGYLLRKFTDIVSVSLAGDNASVPLPLSNPLDSELPSSVTGDISVTYQGIRVLDYLSDEIETDAANVGNIITSESVKPLPPEALSHWPVARIGVLGRAPEECELVLELIDYTGNIPGEVLAKADALTIAPSHSLKSHWFSFDQQTIITKPMAVRLRCNRGRFFWLTDDQQQGKLRVAVYDPDPGTETLMLNGEEIADGSQLPLVARSFNLPTHAFINNGPTLASNLFLDIDISDLRLRYAR